MLSSIQDSECADSANFWCGSVSRSEIRSSDETEYGNCPCTASSSCCRVCSCLWVSLMQCCSPSPAERVQIQPSFGVEVCPEARHNPPIAESPVSTQNNPTQQPDHFTTPVRKRSQPDTVVLEYKKSDPVVSLSLESKKACEDRSVFLERLPKDKKDA